MQLEEYCNADIPLCAAVIRVYELQAVATTPGTKPTTITLTKPDDNPANNQDDAILVAVVTCGSPLGTTAPRPACPGNMTFTGPANKPVSSSSDFAAQCCVSFPAARLSLQATQVKSTRTKCWGATAATAIAVVWSVCCCH